MVRQTIHDIGYHQCTLGFDFRSCGIISTINKQSPDIAQGVNEGQGLFKEQGAGDQGLMFGFACDETPQLMPLPIMLSHQILTELLNQRVSGTLPYLRPDAKSQVTVEYDSEHKPVRVHTVVLSTQHGDEIAYDQIVKDMKALIHKVVPREPPRQQHPLLHQSNRPLCARWTPKQTAASPAENSWSTPTAAWDDTEEEPSQVKTPAKSIAPPATQQDMSPKILSPPASLEDAKSNLLAIGVANPGLSIKVPIPSELAQFMKNC